MLLHLPLPMTVVFLRRPLLTRVSTDSTVGGYTLVVPVVERRTRDRKVAGSTPGRGAIKSTRSAQPSIPPG